MFKSKISSRRGEKAAFQCVERSRTKLEVFAWLWLMLRSVAAYNISYRTTVVLVRLLQGFNFARMVGQMRTVSPQSRQMSTLIILFLIWPLLGYFAKMVWKFLWHFFKNVLISLILKQQTRSSYSLCLVFRGPSGIIAILIQKQMASNLSWFTMPTPYCTGSLQLLLKYNDNTAEPLTPWHFWHSWWNSNSYHFMHGCVCVCHSNGLSFEGFMKKLHQRIRKDHFSQYFILEQGRPWHIYKFLPSSVHK